MIRPVTDWPEAPYPGTWPQCSYAVHDGEVHPIAPSADTRSGWQVLSGEAPGCLDDWLQSRGLPGLRERQPVLSFGSNRCPAKADRQGGPAVNLRATGIDLAAVWSHGTRDDGQVVATLVGAAGRRDDFFVSLCSPAEAQMLDEVEGRGIGYDLIDVDPGAVVLENNSAPPRLAAYVGRHPHRWPVAGPDGMPVLLAAMSQHEIAAWRGNSARHWVPRMRDGFWPLN